MLRTILCVNEKLDHLATNQASQAERTKAEIVEILCLNQQKLVETLRGEGSQLQRRLDNLSNSSGNSRRHDFLAAVLTLDNGETKVFPPENVKVPPRLQRQGVPRSVFRITVNNQQEQQMGYQSIGSSSFEDFRSYEQKVLDCLHFRHVTDRYSNISDPHKDTCKWIFDSPLKHKNQWSSFSEWLSGPDSCYWISGKAASGKSTLMKYIHRQQTTHSLLRQWAEPMALSCHSFFFWHLGSEIQKSQQGLLRSLLHDVLQEHRWLILRTMPDLCKEILKHENSALDPPTLSELLRWFRNLIQQAKTKLRLCFIIDGLDEYTGDYSDLIELIRSTASSEVKFVVSSRPIPACIEAFEELPSLRLQDLTGKDIRKYVHDHLAAKLKNKGDEYARLVDTLVEKASGVFLWLVVVVKSLLEGLQNGDKLEELVELTSRLLSEIKPLFMHMLHGVPPRYKKQSFRLLQIALANLQLSSGVHYPLLAIQLSFAEESWEHAKAAKVLAIPRHQEQQICDQFEARLRSRCCGLLEFQEGITYCDIPEPINRPVVGFVHKTAVEFLTELRSDVHEIWGIDFEDVFNPFQALFQSCLLMCKSFPTKIVIGGGIAICWESLLKAMEYAFLSQLKELPLSTEHLDELDKALSEVWRSETTPSDQIETSRPRPVRWSLMVLYYFTVPTQLRPEIISAPSLPFIEGPKVTGEPREYLDIQILSLYWGLSSYIRDKLTQEAEQSRKVEAGRMLQSMSTLVDWPSMRQPAEGKCGLWSSVFEVLLQNGAEPMSLYQGGGDATMWAKLLDTIFETLNARHHEIDKIELVDNSMIDIFEVFIRHGAPLDVIWKQAELYRQKQGFAVSIGERQIKSMNDIVRANIADTEAWPGLRGNLERERDISAEVQSGDTILEDSRDSLEQRKGIATEETPQMRSMRKVFRKAFRKPLSFIPRS